MTCLVCFFYCKPRWSLTLEDSWLDLSSKMGLLYNCPLVCRDSACCWALTFSSLECLRVSVHPQRGYRHLHSSATQKELLAILQLHRHWDSSALFATAILNPDMQRNVTAFTAHPWIPHVQIHEACDHCLLQKVMTCLLETFASTMPRAWYVFTRFYIARHELCIAFLLKQSIIMAIRYIQNNKNNRR